MKGGRYNIYESNMWPFNLHILKPNINKKAISTLSRYIEFNEGYINIILKIIT